MKKFLSVMLSLAIIFSLSATTFAISPQKSGGHDSNLEDVTVVINGNHYTLSSDTAYYDNELGTYVISFIVNGGEITYLSQNDNLQQKQDHLEVGNIAVEMNETSSITPHNAGLWHFFVKEGQYKFEGTRLKASADFVAPKAGGAVSKNINLSISEGFSASVNADMKSWIRGAISGTWTRSFSYSSTYTANLTAGESGYLSFTPYFTRVYGYYQTYVDAVLVSTEYCYGDSVNLTDTKDEPDGRWEFIYYA